MSFLNFLFMSPCNSLTNYRSSEIVPAPVWVSLSLDFLPKDLRTIDASPRWYPSHFWSLSIANALLLTLCWKLFFWVDLYGHHKLYYVKNRHCLVRSGFDRYIKFVFFLFFFSSIPWVHSILHCLLVLEI